MCDVLQMLLACNKSVVQYNNILVDNKLIKCEVFRFFSFPLWFLKPSLESTRPPGIVLFRLQEKYSEGRWEVLVGSTGQHYNFLFEEDKIYCNSV